MQFRLQLWNLLLLLLFLFMFLFCFSSFFLFHSQASNPSAQIITLAAFPATSGKPSAATDASPNGGVVYKRKQTESKRQTHQNWIKEFPEQRSMASQIVSEWFYLSRFSLSFFHSPHTFFFFPFFLVLSDSLTVKSLEGERCWPVLSPGFTKCYGISVKQPHLVWKMGSTGLSELKKWIWWPLQLHTCTPLLLCITDSPMIRKCGHHTLLKHQSTQPVYLWI